ncbi:MAG: redoxin family protein [Polyangiales bacterium]
MTTRLNRFGALAAVLAGGVLLASPLLAAPQAASAVIGKPAPDFTLRDTDGQTVSLHDLRGKTVILEWFNPDCPFIQHAHTKGPLKDLAKRVSSDRVVWLAINSNAAGKQGAGLDRNKQARTQYGLSHRILLDESGQVGHTYGAEKTPHLFVIDPKGALVYRGGLDNAPIGKVDDQRPHLPGVAKDALEPYLENALADLAANKAIRLPDTPAYGCTVKYGD